MGWPCSTTDKRKGPRGHGGAPNYGARKGTTRGPVPTRSALTSSGKLTAKKIVEWHRGLATKPALAPSKPGRQPNLRKVDASADGVRKRRATATASSLCPQGRLQLRVEGRTSTSDHAWRRVSPFRAVETPRVRYLSETESVRLVNVCEPAFRDLARGALLTGCRYSELATMRVADFNADAGVVTVRESKAGKSRHVVLTDEGRRLFATLTAGKLGKRADIHAPRRRHLAQVAPNAADARRI